MVVVDILIRTAGTMSEASAPVRDTVGVWHLVLPKIVPVRELVVAPMATSNSVPVLAPVIDPTPVTSQSPAVREIDVTVLGVAVVRAVALPTTTEAEMYSPTCPAAALLPSVTPEIGPEVGLIVNPISLLGRKMRSRRSQ